MAIRRVYKEKFKNVELISGQFYTFENYLRYENDPAPTILFMYVVRGVHPVTKHYHNYIQAWNLAYIPKKIRRPFVRNFLKRNWTKRSGVAKRGMRLGPYEFSSTFDLAIRRYIVQPATLIRTPRHIDFEYMDQVLRNIDHKDYSSRVKRTSASRLLDRPFFRTRR